MLEQNLNPLLSDSPNIPWTETKEAHLVPALQFQMEAFKRRFQQILEQPAEPTFENTVLAIDFASEGLDRVFTLYSLYSSCLRTPAFKAIQKEVIALSSELTHLMMTDRRYFDRVDRLRAQLPKGSEEYEIVDDLYDSFVQNGIHLSPENQLILKETNQRLSELSQLYRNQSEGRRASIRIKVTDAADLKGLNAQNRQALMEKRDAAGNFWIEITNNDLISDILENSPVESLRKRVFYAEAKPTVARKYLTEEEAGEAWKIDNDATLIEIANLRIRVARLLGYQTYADLALKDRMAKNIGNVRQFYQALVPGVIQLADKEKTDLLKFAQTLDPKVQKIDPWMRGYYATQMEKALFSVDQEKIREYFELDRTLRSVFDFFSDLFQIRFERDSSVKSYLPEVQVYRIVDSETGKLLSELHLDLFLRPETKNTGAWKASYQKAGLTSRGRQTSILGIALNLTRAPEGLPTLMRLDEVNTLFHELGHGVHEALSSVKYQSLAGTSVARDFVEFPSQIMENWLYTPEFLEKDAVHYQTGEPIPQDWIEKLKASMKFMAGSAIRRQATLGLIDLSWHTLSEPLAYADGFAEEFERGVYSSYSIPIEGDFNPISGRFNHIFAGGYAMGYYGYLWGNVIEADGFDYWSADRTQIREKALQLRHALLSQGGVRDGDVLFRAWTGRDYSPAAFLKRNGL
jgi:Zn-dependent oligopeptidase